MSAASLSNYPQQQSPVPIREQLRLITYMYPSHPMELYEGIVEYLETATGAHITLQHEWRDLEGRADPFERDYVDIAFMTASMYMKLVEDKNTFAELLPATPVFKHKNNTSEAAGYYADVIVHIDKMRKQFADELLDLRGSRWAYSNANSISGSKILLNRLKDLGENASFFGNALRSGSHLDSLKMVMSKQAEAASIDATTLEAYRNSFSDTIKDVVVLESIGPLPPYPIVVNNRLSESLRRKLASALLAFPYKDPKLAKFGLVKFIPNYRDAYDEIKEINKSTGHTRFDVPYY